MGSGGFLNITTCHLLEEELGLLSTASQLLDQLLCLTLQPETSSVNKLCNDLFTATQFSSQDLYHQQDGQPGPHHLFSSGELNIVAFGKTLSE